MRVERFDAAQAKALKDGEYLALAEYPGLRLVAGKAAKSWIYRYAHPGDKSQRQVRLGHWPATGLNLAVASWQEARSARDAGRDVGAELRSAVRQSKAKATEVKAKVKAGKAVTLGLIVDEYLEELIDRNRKPKGATETRRMLERAVERYRKVPVAEFTKRHASAIVKGVAKGEPGKGGAPRVAAMTRQELRAAWAYAIDNGRTTLANPFIGAKLGGAFKFEPRKRKLSPEEVGSMLRWLREPNTYSRTVADALELALRTCLRTGEVCGIHARELREREGVLWLDIPAERMKEGEAHSVPLIGRAREIVEQRLPTGGGFLFPARGGRRAIEQKVLGVEVYAHSGRSESEAYKGKRICPVSDWAPHDLRRTARNFLEKLGCPFALAEELLAHKLSKVQERCLDMSVGFEEAKIAWITKLNEDIDSLVRSNVVQLRAA